MDQGEEGGAATLKEERLDFALWKSTKEGEDTTWDSPWGPGRPAWHIECSVMAERELGASFAVHGGCSDLVFPHHENEIAQSESAGRPFAHVWMHNGMVDVGAEKMSKSEGNIFQLSEALDRYGREAVVAYLISGHYRQAVAFGEVPVGEAVTGGGGLRCLSWWRKRIGLMSCRGLRWRSRRCWSWSGSRRLPSRMAVVGMRPR